MAAYSSGLESCNTPQDCIFEEVQMVASDIEEAWSNRIKPWFTLLHKATAKWLGLFGGSDPKWLYWTLFQPEKAWPKGLSEDDRQILRMAQKFHHMHPSGLRVDRSIGQHWDPDDVQQQEATLRAMRSFAALLRKRVARPMWDDYDRVIESYVPSVMKMCEAAYGEPCSTSEVLSIIKGDLERGWKSNRLDVSQAMYQIYPRFKSWISA